MSGLGAQVSSTSSPSKYSVGGHTRDLPIADLEAGGDGGGTGDSFASIDWSKRPGLSQGRPLEVQIVLAFGSWDIHSANGKEMLTWKGALEMYWTDERLVGYDTS